MDYYPYIFYSYLTDGYQMNLQGAWNNLFVKVHLDNVFNIYVHEVNPFVFSSAITHILIGIVIGRNVLSFFQILYMTYTGYFFNKLSVMFKREVKPQPF